MKMAQRISRREFLVGAGGLTPGALLAAGAQAPPVPTPTKPAPAATPMPAAKAVTVRVAIMSAHGMSDSGEEIAKQFSEKFAPT